MTLNRQQKKHWELGKRPDIKLCRTDSRRVEQFVHDDEKKHVDVPGSNLSHEEVLDMVIKFKNFAVHKDVNYLQLVLELENLTERKILEQRCNQMQLTWDSFFQRHLGDLDRES